MNNIQHSQTISERWHKLSLSEQMANIGSEFGRLSTWVSKKRMELAKNAAKRCLELLDATENDPRWGGRNIEFDNLKYSVENSVSDSVSDEIDLNSIKKSFTPFFILAARK